MRVTVERSLGVTVLRLVAGEVPDDQRLVTRGGQEHVGAGGAQKVSVPSTPSWARVAYFSMEVARLVTQPFCRRTVSKHLGVGPGGNLRGPRGYP